MLLVEKHRKGFRISNPRKGTETGNCALLAAILSLVSAYLIPARGLKK